MSFAIIFAARYLMVSTIASVQASGAGKTTLLKAIAGEAAEGLLTGTMLVNGIAMNISAPADFDSGAFTLMRLFVLCRPTSKHRRHPYHQRIRISG